MTRAPAPQVLPRPAGAGPQVEGPVYVITDCGSTTTKAVLVGRRGGRHAVLARGEAPTTVEAPFADVTLGIWNALDQLAAASGRRLTSGAMGPLLRPATADQGLDLFLSTSSAGGGLQMLVLGLVRELTAASAARAALGAGAIVTDVLAYGDLEPWPLRVARLQEARPDMLLLSGGVDGGARDQVVALAELIAAAAPATRWAGDQRLPLVYAGNREASEAVTAALGDAVELSVVANLRPTLDSENLEPVRRRIHQLFLEHVMGRAPGSRGLLALCDAPVLPTPAAVGAMVQMLASGRRGDVLAVDVGGATTDVFSVVGGRFSRTVSANLGLSYSILQVWQEVGPERIARWLPDPPPAWMMHDRIANKMLRPTVVPASPEALALEQAVAREALALALATHGEAIRRTAGRRRDRDVGEAFGAAVAGDGLDLSRVELIVASGGVLSRAPRAEQAALVLIDALQPVGVTELLLDAAYILPHLGVLAVEAPAAAAEALEAALVPLACCVAPRTADRPAGAPLLRCRLEAEGGALREHLLRAGELARWPLEPRSRGLLRLLPERGVDAGAGPGRSVEQPVHGGVAGVILDGRGRPLILPEAAEERSARLRAWRRALACEPGSSS